MRRIIYLTTCALSLFASAILSPFPAQASPQAGPQRGIAVLSSSIGSDYSPEALAETVRQANFSPVVIDWAWITYHWDKTNFPAVNRFLQLMVARGVPVAAMYRPRFLNETPTVPIQVDAAGKPVVSHGNYICFSSPEARQWGISWGTKILQKCPQFDEIIIYNPLNQCQCPTCQAAARDNRYAAYDAVWQFLADAKSTWQKQKPGVKLGLVYVTDLDFWKRGAQIVDAAHPYLFITDNTDFAKDAAAASAVRNLLPGRAGSCLAKITWGDTDKVSSARLAEFDRTAAQAGLPYFFWTAETLFDPSLYNQQAVAQILRSNPLASSAQAITTTPPQQKPMPSANIPPSQKLPQGVAHLLKQIQEGPDQAAAIDPLVALGKQCNAQDRGAIIAAVAAVMADKSKPEYSRWLCCYVLSGMDDERAVPELNKILLSEPSEIIRSVSAEAMGMLYKDTNSSSAHESLMQAGRKDASPRVREVLVKYLGQEMPPAPAQTTAPAPAAAQPPAGPAAPAGAGNYTAAQIQNTSTETFLARLLQPDPGHGQFDALQALSQKAKQSSLAKRNQILSLVVKTLQNKQNPAYQRWQCCYVLSGSSDERVIPYLRQALLQDPSELVRSVAAEALSQFPNNAAAHNALLESARQETSPTVRDVLIKHLGDTAPPAPVVAKPASVPELTPNGPPQPPAGPQRPVGAPLPWPFPGSQQDQTIFNNYQQATDGYIHCGLDFIHPAGTPVTAVDSGYVRMIFTNYPEWITHYCFFISSQKGGNVGWCYTHIDPRTFPYKVGDYVPKGANLGSLVDFSVGDHPGVAHLHLQYGRLIEKGQGKADAHSLIDPLYFFDWKDTQAPVFQPLRFVTANTNRLFPADGNGVTTVSGKVDILAAITDSAYPGHMGNIGVPVVMLSISDGTHTMQKLVLDYRGEVVNETQVKPLFLTWDEKKAFFDPESFPRYQMMRVTKTNGDGQINPQDAAECWDTDARDAQGRPLWPDGQYAVNVYAWDIAGNRAVVGALVQVKNH